ncbi:MAG: hypothetical protein Q4C50_03910 [Eubacteriales bacterium]|nr:hypothetical protein [Eubacteriales bacterium]
MFENVKLEDGEVLIVGVYTYAKNGKNGTTISFVREFKSWQIERGLRTDGVYAETEFTHMDCTGLQVGDIVRLAYQKGFQGKADLIGYSLVKRAAVEKG